MTTIAGPGIDPARIAQVKAIHERNFGEPATATTPYQDAIADAVEAEPDKTARELDTEARAERYGVAFIELVGVIELLRGALTTEVSAALFGAGGPVDQMESTPTRVLVRNARRAMKGNQ